MRLTRAACRAMRPDAEEFFQDRGQYRDSSRLRARMELHQRYSTTAGSFHDWVLDKLGDVRGRLVLDAGCGPGSQYHPLLRRRGARVVGVDRSPGMAREAGGICGDLVQLPFAAGAFDRVMCNHVLYHVADRRSALEELSRVSALGGRVVITTNAAGYMREAPEIGRDSPFSTAHDELVRSVFPDVRLELRPNEVVVDTVEPFLRYAWSIDLDDERTESLRRRVEEAIAREGAFRMTTTAGCWVATR